MNFFTEFKKLSDTTPRPALFTTNMQNSPYTNFSVDSKNCYLVFACADCEDCYYGVNVIACRDCINTHNVRNCELCYECIDCENCYNGNFLQDCRGTRDSSYCFDCIGCEYCFGCVSLRQKSYYIFNQQYDKKTFEEKLKEVLRLSEKEILAKFEALKQKTPRVFMRAVNTENSSGDYLINTKNCHICFDAKESEDCMYNDRPFNVKDSVDCANLYKNNELCYEVMSGIDLHNVNFSFLCWYGHDLEYCMYCFNSHHLFGCVSRNHAEYEILNQKYEPTEWHKKVAEIKTDKTYGKMIESDFPIEDSIFNDYLNT